jgi:hypothetical protein
VKNDDNARGVVSKQMTQRTNPANSYRNVNQNNTHSFDSIDEDSDQYMNNEDDEGNRIMK